MAFAYASASEKSAALNTDSPRLELPRASTVLPSSGAPAVTVVLPDSLAPNILAIHRGGLISNTVLGASDGATSLLLSSMSRSIAVFLEPNPRALIMPRRLAADDRVAP